MPSTAITDLSHAATQLSKRKNFKPKALCSDTWPAKIECWALLFGDELEGRLGLFRFMQRMTRALRKKHVDHFQALNALLKCVCEYDTKNYEDLLCALKEGTLNGKKHTNEDIATLKSSDIHSARNLGEEISLEWARKWQLKNTQLSETLTDSKLHLPQISSSSNLPKLEQLPIGFSRSYSYLGVQTEDIRVADIPSLLDEYQELVRFCESLLTTRNAEIVAEHKRKMRELRYHLEIQAAAADLQLLNQSDNWGI